jgi:hypothetical protein
MQSSFPVGKNSETWFSKSIEARRFLIFRWQGEFQTGSAGFRPLTKRGQDFVPISIFAKMALK